MIPITRARTSEDYAAARALLLEYAEGLGVSLCFQDFSRELEQLASMYGEPDACLFLAREGDGIAGCVAVRRRGADTCEMKRLYVRPAARGAGLGRRLAASAVEAARALGYRRVVLDTLESMDAARAIYRSLGFRDGAAYYSNPLPGVHYMALELGAGVSA